MDKFVYWTPRALSILFIGFLALFSLDVFEENLGFWGTVLGLFMHNIPAIILAIVLWISWRREIIAGIVYILAGVLYIAGIFMNIFQDSFRWYMLFWILMISGPAFLIGILFLINWRKRIKN